MKTKGKEKDTTGSNKAPVFQKRIGSIRATVWENDVDGRCYFNINLVRRFKDGDEWRDTPTLNNCGDALAAIEALRRCIDFIDARETEMAADVSED